MRLKLVLIASLLAAVIGVGSGVAIIYFAIGPRAFVGPQFSNRSHGWLEIVMLVPPVLLASLAGLFVYRHTARRRKLQAALTAIIAISLSLVFYIAVPFVFYR